MLKYFLTLIFLICIRPISFSQDSQYKQLIDTAAKKAGLFVGIQPETYFKVNDIDTSFYDNYHIDSLVFKELVNNAKHPDTSSWSDIELGKSIVVKTRDEYIYLKDVLKKFKTTNKQEIKSYRNIVNDFNNTDSWDKNISYFSRPVFDNSGQFAIIQYDNGHSGLAGGGEIILYHFEGNRWKEIEGLVGWKY